MTEFTERDLSEARFEDVSLKGSSFSKVDLSDARFRNVDMRGASIRGALLVDVDLYGELRNVTVNGVDVVPLVEAELNRRYPDRAKMRPRDAAGFREAWTILERLWDETVARARSLPPELLHVRVDDEWSFIETLRHLVFATDAWINRALLGNPSPWDPLDLPFDEMPEIPGIPWDRAVRPGLDEVLTIRSERTATVRGVVESLTDDRLSEMTEPVAGPGYPESQSFSVRECLEVILSEEWEHRLYAERDLAVLESRQDP
jgi:hypothetical protein